MRLKHLLTPKNGYAPRCIRKGTSCATKKLRPEARLTPLKPRGGLSAQSQDRWPLRLGIAFLGLIALVCIFALIYLSQKPAPPGTTEAANAQAAASKEGTPADAAGPVATQVAAETGTLGLLGQIVGVLATVAAAAVGGLAGFLTGARADRTGAAPAGGTGQGGSNDL